FRNTPSTGHQAEGRTSGKESDICISAVSPKVPNQGVIDLNHQGRKVQKGRRYLKGWRKVVYSTGILRAVTKVPAREEQNLLQRKKNSKRESSRRTKALSEGMDSAGGHWKSRSKRQKSSVEEKKCIKDPVEIYNIKQRDGESMEEFVRMYNLKCRDVKGAPECMKISGFMHEITYPELIKRLHDKIPKLVDEMMRVTTTFLRGEVAASNRERKKSFPSWKQQEAGQRKNFKKGSFQNQQRSEQKQDRFTLLTKTTKEILALDKGKFKPHPPMTTQVEKRNASKFCEFHGEERPGKGGKEGETSEKDKPLAILMEDGTEGPMIIKAEMEGNFVQRMYVDGGSSSEILYEHCFNRFRPEVRSQMVLAATPLVGFSGEIIWPMGQISLLVKIGDKEHSTLTWMNFMVVRSPSPYNGIIGRLGVRIIRAVQSMAHGMLKFPVTGGIVTVRSSRIIPLECTMVLGPRAQQPAIDQVTEEKIQVAIHPEYPK
ncbi:hypothetical protein Tco_0840506, partial [Tanacetum coccineum]